MNYLAESFAWCMLQVTLFTAIAAGVHVVIRRLRAGTSSALLAASLAVVGLLTLASASPWPRWDALRWKSERATVWRVELTEPGFNAVNSPELPAKSPRRPGIVSETFEAPHPTLPESPAADFGELSRVEAASPSADRVWVALVFVAWIAAAYGFVRAMVGIIHLRRICRHSTPIDDGTALQHSHALCEQLGIRRIVELRESSQLGGAATVGWRRPIVLLPQSWHDWSPDELRAVLAHELAHVRQRHFPAWLVSQAALVAHYYHPIVHWLARRLRLEQEIDADRLAAEIFGDRRRYAAVLAKLALGPMPAKFAFAGVGLFMSRPVLMRRIAMLRQSSDSTQGSSRVGQFAVLFVLAAAAVSVAGLRAEQPADAEVGSSAAPALPDVTTPPLESTSAEAAAATPAPPIEATAQTAVAADRYVTALVRVSREPVSVLDGRNQQESNASWQVFCKTQLALIKSYFVLNAAVRSREIAGLPMLRAAPDPEAMLQQRVKVGFYPDTEIMFVQMAIKPSEADPARKIVNAVVKAYIDKVVNAERQHQLKFRDQLARSLNKLEDELKRRLDEYYSIAKELQSVEDSGSGQILQELDMRRLDRVETELMRLEDEVMKLRGSGRVDKVLFASYEERIEQLNSRADEIEKRLRARSEKSVELSTRKREIDQLQKIAGDMTMKLEVMDIDAEAAVPATIRVIQPATATGTTPPPKNSPR